MSSAENAETIPSPEKIQATASEIFEEEKNKLKGKIEGHLVSGEMASLVSVLSLGAILLDQPEMANPNVIEQGFNFFGASPAWTALLNMGIMSYDIGRVEVLSKKLDRLRKPKQKTSDVSGSE